MAKQREVMRSESGDGISFKQENLEFATEAFSTESCYRAGQNSDCGGLCHFTWSREFSQAEVGAALMERQNMFIIVPE